MTKVKKICEVCGKPFLVKPSEKNARFCSQKCVAKWRSEFRSGENSPRWKGRISITCEICGNIFLAKPWVIKRGRGKFCSLQCYAEWRSRQFRGEDNPAWKGGKVKRVCETCGSIFVATPANIEKGHDRFCSRECWGKWKSDHIRGKNSPTWKGGKIKRICETCGITFYRYPSKIKMGAGKYCSLSCARQAKVYPKHHTKPEVIFEAICKKNNIPFHYVGDGQLWIGKKKKLNPDFIEANGKKICIEIFGDYWHSPLLNRNMKESATLKFRTKHYRRFKWIPVFVWEADLIRDGAEQFVLNLLQKEGAIK